MTNLLNKSSFTFFESIISIDKLISHAKKLNLKSVSLIDTQNLYGAYEFYKKCKENDLKPIIGIEIKNDDINYLFIAKNYKGYKNLIELSSFIMSGKDYKSQELKKYVNDLILVNIRNDENFFSSKDDFYTLFKTNSIYTTKVTHLLKGDKKARNLFKLVGEGKTIDDINEVDSKTSHLLSEDELNKLSTSEQKKNLEKLINSIDLELPKSKKMNFIDYSNDDYGTLKKICEKELKEYLKKENISNRKEYIGRTQHELTVIKKIGFSNYFLVVQDYVDWARKNDILVGPGRGSVGGSIVAFLLKITGVDPIKANLLFERFLNTERISMPDIDVDFQDDRRDEVIEYIRNKYGNDHFCQIITFQTLKAKMSIKDMARVLKYDLKRIDALSKLIPLNNSIDETIKSVKKFSELMEKESDLKELISLARKIEGLPRQFSTHAAGIVISKDKISKILPIQKGYGNSFITQYSMNYLEENGLIKLDILGLKNLTIISEILEKIKERKNIEISLDEIDLNDKATSKLLSQGSTEGIFQLESSGMKSVLVKMKAKTMEDVVATTSLYRPGPSDNIPSFISRKLGNEKIDYIDDSFKKHLESTYGIIVYQEQIMSIVQDFANFSLSKADILRKAIGKKDEDLLNSLKKEFFIQSEKKGKDKETIQKVYDLIYKFSNYGFNRSHAYTYSIVSYWMLYLKANFPLEFFSSLLSSYIGNFSKIQTYFNEASKLGIKILAPSINYSTDKFIIKNEKILYPLTSINNFGVSAYKTVLEDRKNFGLYSDLIECLSRVFNTKISITAMKALVDSGSLVEFGYNWSTIYKNLDSIKLFSNLISKKEGGKNVFDKNLFKSMDKPKIVSVKNNDIEFEKSQYDAIGLYLREHPIQKIKSDYLKESKNENIDSISQVREMFDHNVKLIVNVISERKVKTKYGSMMIFGVLEDETGQMNYSVSPKYYKDIFTKFERGNILIINAKIDKFKGGTISITGAINFGK